ncbi:unnamed protein product [Coccothraustes coccothraustes]
MGRALPRDPARPHRLPGRAGEAAGPRPGQAMAAAANIWALLSPAPPPARAQPGSAGPQEQPRAGPARPRFCHPWGSPTTPGQGEEKPSAPAMLLLCSGLAAEILALPQRSPS